jgi:formyl-CoA transferase
MLLAQLGAEVVTVDFGESQIDDELRDGLDRQKQRVALDLETSSGRKHLLELVREADGLVEDLGAGELAARHLSVRRLRRYRRELVVASVSPFGQGGPYAGWQASELVVQAMGGIVQSTGWDAEPPTKLAGCMAAFIAGLHAAMAVFAGVFGAHSGRERGVQLDISAQETFMQHWSRHIGQWAYNGIGQRRDQRTLAGQGVPSMARASDGWICLAVRNARWDVVCDLLGLQAYTGSEWQTQRARAERWPELEPAFEAALASRTRDEWFTAAAERGLIFGPVHSLQEVLQSEHYAARGYFLQAAGLPFKWEE